MASTDRTITAITAAYELGPHHTPTESLAFDLYSASFFTTVADARLLMLMMSVETLLVPADRPGEVQAHVRELLRDLEIDPNRDYQGRNQGHKKNS